MLLLPGLTPTLLVSGQSLVPLQEASLSQQTPGRGGAGRTPLGHFCQAVQKPQGPPVWGPCSKLGCLQARPVGQSLLPYPKAVLQKSRPWQGQELGGLTQPCPSHRAVQSWAASLQAR